MPSDDLVLNVRQITQFPLESAVAPTDAFVLQSGGVGGPYYSTGAQNLVSTGLMGSALPLMAGEQPPTPAYGSQVISGTYCASGESAIFFNAYYDASGVERALSAGGAAYMNFNLPTNGLQWGIAGPASAGAQVKFTDVLIVQSNGEASLPLGSLTVAHDPTSPHQVATANYVDQIRARMVTTFMGRTGDILLGLSDIVFAGGAPIYSPCFTGCPTAPTPAPGDSSTAVATTAFVANAVSSYVAAYPNLVSTFNGRSGAVVLTANDVSNALAGQSLPYAPLASPQFSGVPTAPTAAPGDATGTLATTAFVMHAITAGTAGVSSFNTRTGAVVLAAGDITSAGGALLASPPLTGTPTAPTAAPGTNTTQLATTAFVETALGAAGGVSSFNTRTGAVTLTTADITGAGGAPSASPALSGVPTAPTAALGTNTTQLATTAFVLANSVASFNGRTGAVSLQANDVSAVGGALLASPAFTGIPTASTATAGTNTNQLATTAFVAAAVSAGAVTSFNSRTGAVTLTSADVTSVGGALLAGPAFTGIPTAPTAAANSNTTQLATTAYVTASTVASFNGRAGAVTLQASDVSGVGGALLAGPAFTGAPTAPTATAGTNTTQLATCAFVAAAIAASGVTTFNGRAGAVTLTTADVTGAGGAPSANPTFTGLVTVSDSGVKGVTDGSSAPAGSVGELLTAAGSSTALTSATATNVASGSMTIPAGDWDISGYMVFSATNGATAVLGSFSNASGVIQTPGMAQLVMTSAVVTNHTVAIPTFRANLSAPATYYAVAQLNFSSGTAQCGGSLMQARRRR